MEFDWTGKDHRTELLRREFDWTGKDHMTELLRREFDRTEHLTEHKEGITLQVKYARNTGLNWFTYVWEQPTDHIKVQLKGI